MKRLCTATLTVLTLSLSVILQAPGVFSQEPGNAASKSISISGLKSSVTVRRDERGIPYIEAANDEDLYFAQGYITASDRLWQMDLLRRTVRGELAEIFGSGALSQDKLHRTFGFGRIIDENATRLTGKLKVALNAYAQGVNAYIASLTPQTLPPEFGILQYKPRPWMPADSLAVGKLLAEYLSNTWQLDVMRASLATLPSEKRAALLPEVSPLDVLVVGGDGKQTKTETQGLRLPAAPPPALLAELNKSIEDQRRSFERLGFPSRPLESLEASNNWVVSGKRTASGKPLLANDPHIPAAAPGVWHIVELSSPGIHAAGVTFPGAPGIVLGHNDFIAWGATNLGPDVQDVYAEKFDKDNPRKYLTPSGWRDAEVRKEEIKVRKGFGDPSTDTVTMDVIVTRHGPIVLEKDSTRYALHWPALDPETMESAGLFEANRARNWKEFTEALSHYSGPTQNFVFADVNGHIGYYGAGRIPIRKTGDGSVPYDGATDEGEWTGYLSFDKLPHVYDPGAGIIVTANQRVVGTDYPYFLSHAWAQPYRARRIFSLLSEKQKLTIDDFRRIQGDVYSYPAAVFARAAVKTLKASAGNDEKLNSLLVDFEKWDGRLTIESRAALLSTQMRSAFRTRVLTAALGPELMKSYVWPEADTLIDRVLETQPREWLPSEFTNYADLFRASYSDAKQAVTKSLGADESQWTWGSQTKARFPHPLAAAPFIGVRFTIPPMPQNGAGQTVNVGASVSMRLIADTSDWDKSLNGVPLGESGLPDSPHWKDQLDDWRNVTPRPVAFSKVAVEKATKETVVLEPK